MRRGLASLIMGLSLVVATAGWAGFILSRTVLDPGRSEALAETLLDNEDVRAVIVDRLADAVEAQLPAAVPVSRQTIERAADAALDDPRVEAVVQEGIVKTHQNALAGIDEPVMLDASALGEVAREMVVGLRPELDSLLPAAPSLEVELPSSGLSWLGRVKNTVDRFTAISAAIALIGLTTAFVVARNRPAVLRRVAFWAFGASLFWVAVAYGVPALLGRIAPASVSITMAIIDVFFGAMIRPAMVMGGVGVALLLLSFVWPAITRRRSGAMLDRPRPAQGALDQHRPVLEGLSTSGGPAYSPSPQPEVTTAMWVDNATQWPEPDSPTVWADNPQPSYPQAEYHPPPHPHQPPHLNQPSYNQVEYHPPPHPNEATQTAQPPAWTASTAEAPTNHAEPEPPATWATRPEAWPANEVDPDAETQIFHRDDLASSGPGGSGNGRPRPDNEPDWVEGTGYTAGEVDENTRDSS